MGGPGALDLRGYRGGLYGGKKWEGVSSRRAGCVSAGPDDWRYLRFSLLPETLNNVGHPSVFELLHPLVHLTLKALAGNCRVTGSQA